MPKTKKITRTTQTLAKQLPTEILSQITSNSFGREASILRSFGFSHNKRIFHANSGALGRYVREVEDLANHCWRYDDDGICDAFGDNEHEPNTNEKSIEKVVMNVLDKKVHPGGRTSNNIFPWEHPPYIGGQPYVKPPINQRTNAADWIIDQHLNT